MAGTRTLARAAPPRRLGRPSGRKLGLFMKWRGLRSTAPEAEASAAVTPPAGAGEPLGLSA
jgi:hypothetical protein